MTKESTETYILELTPFKYRTRAIITRSRFEAALDYKPQVFLKNYLFLVNKLSAV